MRSSDSLKIHKVNRNEMHNVVGASSGQAIEVDSIGIKAPAQDTGSTTARGSPFCEPLFPMTAGGK
jgi:hypothetical protein